MAKNPYFLDNSSEHSLIESIGEETITAMGRDIYYIPRKLFNKDYLYGEDTVSKFKGSYKLSAYVNSVSGFQGQGDLISKFGIELKDRVELVVGKRSFEEIVTRSDSEISRPTEGDLVYFIDSDTLFEINFVEHENPFYALGSLYTYVLSCEAFTYTHEDFDTDQNFIDDIETETSTELYELYMTITGGVDYTVGENVFQIIGNPLSGGTATIYDNADATARVYNWKSDTGLLFIGDQTGSFGLTAGASPNGFGPAGNIYIHGASSGATGEVTSLGSLTTKTPTSPETNTSLFDDIGLAKERQEDGLFDFTDKDPFSEGNY
tara:strand:- start:819 stop:1781 length:963 start_codon:yes stop_codon:yes gene_type:complete